VRGFYLRDACKYFEFRVAQSDVTQARARLTIEVVRAEALRDFLGFNRAKHAVVEAAILATRLHLLPLDVVSAEFDRLQILVEKTGGVAERAAFELLRAHLEQALQVQANGRGADSPDTHPALNVEDDG
jgi:hypothetical protein